MTRRGFTLLELMLATLLSSFVLITCLGLIRMMDVSDRGLNERFASVREFSSCQGVLQRAFQTMVAAPDSDPAGDASSGDDDEPEVSPTGQVAGPPPHFWVRPLERQDDIDGASVGEAAWRVELVLTEPPFPTDVVHFGAIRGAFDIEGEPGNWRLVWTSLDPPGEARVLADDLIVALVSVMPYGESLFTDRLRVREVDEFPRAIRFVLWSADGTKVDWIFEPGIRLGEI